MENLNIIEKGLTGLASYLVYDASSMDLLRSSSRGRAAFQWGGTISAIILLILNRVRRRPALQTTLLALFLFTSFPTVLFKTLRGQFGYWIAFLAVAANLFFSETFPVSRFLLFVITPERLADGLRDTIAGGIFCLALAVSILVIELREIGGVRSCGCNMYCVFYSLGIGFLFFFTILYLSK